jgi:hypothetical protein
MQRAQDVARARPMRPLVPALQPARIESALRHLADKPPAAPPEENLNAAQAFDPCAGPDSTPPFFVVPFRRALLLSPLPFGEFPSWSLACVRVDSLFAYMALDLRFEQLWNLYRLSLGDLSSTMTLAPSEDLTLEFRSTQRRLLDQDTVDSAEALTSNESTTVDKEVVNVARSSARTQNWHVDGGGSFSIGVVGVNANAGVSNSASDSSQSSIQHITESTRKSAHSLKTLHKIEVRGVTETFIDNRQTRRIRNPYPDHSLMLNVFQLIKHFSVRTSLVEVRPILLIEVRSLVFDEAFVVANSDFLQANLLDSLLLDQLSVAIQGAAPLLSSGALEEARDAAKLALRYLCDIPNVFNVPPIPRVFGQPDPAQFGDPNNPETSFNAQATRSGFNDSLGKNDDVVLIFTSLNLFFRVYRELRGNQAALDKYALDLAVALAADVDPKWTELKGVKVNDRTAIDDIEDFGDFTEILRRLSGFLAMVNGIVKPLVDPASQDEDAIRQHEVAAVVASRLIDHLNCHKDYYIQRFLSYVARRTNGEEIAEFARQVVNTANVTPAAREAIVRLFDIDRSFVDGQDIVVPSVSAVTLADLAALGGSLGLPGEHGIDPEAPAPEVPPAVIEDLEVPCDGIHLEVALGRCVLDNPPPPPPAESLDLSLQGASLRVGPQ